VLFIDYKI